jgi:hypothetical protein
MHLFKIEIESPDKPTWSIELPVATAPNIGTFFPVGLFKAFFWLAYEQYATSITFLVDGVVVGHFPEGAIHYALTNSFADDNQKEWCKRVVMNRDLEHYRGAIKPYADEGLQHNDNQ